MNELVKATLLYYIYKILPLTASTPLPYMSLASLDQQELLLGVHRPLKHLTTPRMNPPSVSHQRPENIAELVGAYLQAPGVIIQRSLPMETLRVPRPPTYNIKFILKRF